MPPLDSGNTNNVTLGGNTGSKDDNRAKTRLQHTFA